MFVKEVRADFLGHQVVVRNQWGPLDLAGEAKLYIDGAVVDTSKEWVSFGRTPLMRGTIVESGALTLLRHS